MTDVVFCKCGRNEAKLHCPYCGNATVVARPSMARVVDNINIMSYRCRRCGKIFDDIARELCSAPPPVSRSVEHKMSVKVDAAVAVLPREDRLKWVQDRLRGMQASKSTKEGEIT